MVQISVDVDLNKNEQTDSEQRQSVNDTSNSRLFTAVTNSENDDLLQWFDVARNGNLDDMKELLLHGADVGWEDDEKRTALHICAAYGYCALASLLLDYGIAVDAKDEDSSTALHLATWHGKPDIVRMLLYRGADIEAKDDNLETALHMAVSRRSRVLVHLLLDRGAFPDPKDYRSWTPLHIASCGGHKAFAKILLDNGAYIEATTFYAQNALRLAAEDGHAEVVQLLLDYGANVHAIDHDTPFIALHESIFAGNQNVTKLLLSAGSVVDMKDYRGITALHCAAMYGRKEAAELLLSHGATIDIKSDHSKETALHMAAKHGEDKLVNLLLNNGASSDALDINSETPIYLAARNGSNELLSLMLAHCEFVDQMPKSGIPILVELSELGKTDLVTLLLRHGADIEILDAEGQTPLVVAAKAAQLDMVSLLLDEGANIKASDNDSLTALHWAAREGNLSVLEVLLQNNAEIEAIAKQGNTALHLAVESNNCNIVTTLIKHHANLNVENEDEHTPIQMAILRGHIDIVHQLKNAGAIIAKSGDDNMELLFLASDAGQVGLIKRSLEMISNDDERIFSMNATLNRASQHGKFEVVSYLLETGADLEAYDNDGLPPIFLAGQYPELIARLVHRGACVNTRSKSKSNHTAMHHFAYSNHIRSLLLLLNCGCNIHLTDKKGNTALHYAARSNDGYEASIVLLQHGVDINAINNQGRTALHDAIDYNSLRLSKVLLEEGIDINAQEESGGTALYYAAIGNRTDACALLLKHGANANILNGSMRSPLDGAVENCNLDLVRLLLDYNAIIYNSKRYNTLQRAIDTWRDGIRVDFKRGFISTVKLLIETGADTLGIQVNEELERTFPKLNDTIAQTNGPSINEGRVYPKEPPSIIYGDVVKMDEAATLKAVRSNDGRELKETLDVERRSVVIEHKYGFGFPHMKRLQLDEFLIVDNSISLHSFAGATSSAKAWEIFGAIPIDQRAIEITQSLFNCFDARLFMSESYFMVELSREANTIPPKWASHFDKMYGIIREPGRLIVEIPQMRTTLSIPKWHNTIHPYLQFIDAVYVCRRSSNHLDQEVFADVLGGLEQQLAVDLHALLIASLCILSIADGGGLIEKLVMAILNAKMDPMSSPSPHDKSPNWQTTNRRQCPCNTSLFHRPLSPVAAAKAIGMDIWRKRQEQIVNRVWDLHQEKLVHNVDSREVIFVTHRWNDTEVKYQDVVRNHSRMEGSRLNELPISGMSEKLRRIKETLGKHARYVWIDTICIDKSNLSELDEAIRSMYNWYASCAAVVLDSDTPLSVWCKRGWCLQEGAAAGILCGISKEGKLSTIQQLAIEQHQNLCSLDLHLYYRQGNAAEILARMDVRNTTRKEDMAYALAGIFDVHLTLAYGEGIKSRKRLLHELATQKGDLSFLSFETIQPMTYDYLPPTNQTNYLIAKCLKASTSITVSHFGICFEVQLVKGPDASHILQKLEDWKDMKFALGRWLGVEKMIEEAPGMLYQGSSSVGLSVVHDIRSIILVRTYDEDWQAGAGEAIKLCYRLQCCQIEEYEFERLFDDIEVDFERIWLGDKPDGTGMITGTSGRLHRHRKRTQKAEVNEGVNC